MKTIFPLVILTLLTLRLHAEPGHSIGFGANYWQVIDDIDVDNVDENGFSWLLAYRYDGGLLNLHAELETFPEDYAGAPKDVYAPQALVTVGESIFVGVGAGIQYTDGEWADDFYYFFRAGLSVIQLGPAHIDLHANYIFSDFNTLDSDDIDTDTITLGAMVRLDL
jgi:hypothetical protein